jgi:hypothetical protein
MDTRKRQELAAIGKLAATDFAVTGIGWQLTTTVNTTRRIDLEKHWLIIPMVIPMIGWRRELSGNGNWLGTIFPSPQPTASPWCSAGK